MKIIFNRNRKANVYILIGVVVLFILVIGIFLLVSNLKSINAKSENKNSETQEEIIINCGTNQDCKEPNGCKIPSCVEGICMNSEVLLCYNNDDCCPSNCNSANDNDCLKSKS